jgi:ABC-type molybdate transport system substrate-binding protein
VADIQNAMEARMKFTVYLVCLMLSLAVLCAACSGDDSTVAPSITPPAAVSGIATLKPLSGSITVFAASSLTDTFNEIGAKFKSENRVSVTFKLWPVVRLAGAA